MWGLLRRGRAAVKQAAQLTREADLEDDHTHRACQIVVEALVFAGYPICGSRYGYWIAAEAEELDDYSDRLEERAAMVLQRATKVRETAALMRAGKRWPHTPAGPDPEEQGELFGGDGDGDE